MLQGEIRKFRNSEISTKPAIINNDKLWNTKNDILNITQATDLYIDNYSFNLVEFYVKMGKTNRNLWRDFLNFPYFTGFPAP